VARLFNGSSDKGLHTSAVPFSSIPATFFAAVRPDTLTAEREALGMSNSGNTIPLFRIGITSAGKALCQYRGDSSGVDVKAIGATTMSTTVPSRLVGTMEDAGGGSVTSKIYLNSSTADGTATGATNPTITLTQVELGVLQRTSAAQFWDGDIGICAIWNVLLATDEINALMAGWHPRAVRLASLQWACDLYGNVSPELDYIGGLNPTITGTTKTQSPPIILPTMPRIVVPAAAAGGRIMGSLAGQGGLAGPGGLAGLSGGLAG
jgi:hypothetical protein